MQSNVLIIGGGPVGLALAVALSRYQVSSTIIEKRAAPTPLAESRAIVWAPKGLEFLQWLGVLDQFELHGIKRTHHEFRRHGKCLFSLDYDLVDSPFQYSLHMPQYYTEWLLEQEARRSSRIDIRRAEELVGLQQTPSSVVAQVRSLNTGEMYSVESPLLIGCDGAKSIVRSLMDSQLNWQDYGTYSAVADIEANIPGEQGDVSWIELDPKRPVGLFNFHPDKWRIIYRINVDEDRQAAVEPAYVDHLIKTHFPQITYYHLLWASSFRLGQGQSSHYHAGRVVLAGDAAHPMGPSAGAGMMVGMVGVWRLAGRLRTIADETDMTRIHQVLAEYESEQRQGSKHIQRANAITFAQISLKNSVLAVIRSAALRFLSLLPFVRRKLINDDSLTNQTIEVSPLPAL